MRPGNGRGPAQGSRPSPSTYDGAAAGSEITTDHRQVRGAVIVLVDPAGVAEQVIEKRGPTYAAQLALELLAPLRILRAEVASS